MGTEDQLNGSQTKGDLRNKNWPAGDIVLAISMILFAALMFIGTQYFPHRARMGLITSARFTPILLSILVTILCCVLIIMTVRKFGKVSIKKWLLESLSDETTKRSIVLMVMIGVYIFLVGQVNFVAINILFLLVMYWYLRIGSWKIIVAYSLISGLLVSVIVPYIFQMPLP